MVLGDSAYADGATRERLDEAGFEVVAKCPPVRNSTGGFTKDRFDVDLDDRHRHLPGRPHRGHPPLGPRRRQGQLQAALPALPAPRPVHPLAAGAAPSPSTPRRHSCKRARAAQATAEWVSALPGRPAHSRTQDLPLRPPALGRTQGPNPRRTRIATDLDTRAAAINWARLAALGLATEARRLGAQLTSQAGQGPAQPVPQGRRRRP